MVRTGTHSVMASKERGSLYMVLPMEWTKENNIKRGDKVHWVTNGVLVVIPEDKKDLIEKFRGGMNNGKT